MAAIDLGEMPPAGSGRGDRPGRPGVGGSLRVTGGPAGRAASRRPVTRWPWVVAMLAVLLTGVAGAAPARQPPAEATVPAPLGAMVLTSADRLFMAEGLTGGPRTGSWLAAFRLPDGAPLWRVPVTMTGSLSSWTVLDRTLVLIVDWAGVGQRETIGLDVETGQERWRRAAAFEGVTDEGHLLLWWQERSTPGPVTGRVEAWWEPVVDDEPGTLRAVAADDAAVRWSLPVPAGTLRSYRYVAGSGDDPGGANYGVAPATELVIGRQDGRVEVRDLGTGGTLRSAELPGPGPGDGTLAHRVAGDLLLVEDSSTNVTAYGLDGLDQRWRLTRDPARELGPVLCPAGLCLYGRHGGVRVMDLTSGRTRWSDRSWDTLTLVDGRLLASGPGRSFGSGPAGLAVLDPDTGRVLGELGSWQVFWPSIGSGRLIGFRVDAYGKAWVAQLDPTRLTVRILEVLHGVSGNCDARTRVLVCRRTDGSMGLWQL